MIYYLIGYGMLVLIHLDSWTFLDLKLCVSCDQAACRNEPFFWVPLPLDALASDLIHFNIIQTLLISPKQQIN